MASDRPQNVRVVDRDDDEQKGEDERYGMDRDL